MCNICNGKGRGINKLNTITLAFKCRQTQKDNTNKDMCERMAQASIESDGGGWCVHCGWECNSTASRGGVMGSDSCCDNQQLLLVELERN